MKSPTYFPICLYLNWFSADEGSARLFIHAYLDMVARTDRRTDVNEIFMLLSWSLANIVSLSFYIYYVNVNYFFLTKKVMNSCVCNPLYVPGVRSLSLSLSLSLCFLCKTCVCMYEKKEKKNIKKYYMYILFPLVSLFLLSRIRKIF